MNTNGKRERQKNTLVIALFSHIELYPPSLNALFHLAPMFDDVYVLVRNVWNSEWAYPDNVHVVTSGKFVPLDQVGKNTLAKKVNAYVTFGYTLRRLCKEKRPSVVLLYDAGAFSLYQLFKPRPRTYSGPVVWYHNHDVAVEEEVGAFSIMRLMKKFETRYFRRADIFSLPNQVRLKYFPIAALRSTPFIVPNYPSKFFFGKWHKDHSLDSGNVRLIFQGHISPSNRMEEFIGILSRTISGRHVELHLAGPIDPAYEHKLRELAEASSVEDRLFFYGRLPYAELPSLTASCHIGLAIYGFHNTMVRTMSTASNKIFEYASVGLPVLINDREDLRAEFAGYPWIHFSDLKGGLINTLESMLKDYSFYSSKARGDFEDELNFESAFLPLKVALKQKLAS